MTKELDRTEGVREDPFSGIRFTCLMAIEAWVGDIIVAVWKKATEKSLTEGEIEAMGEEAVRALSTPRGFYF